MVAVLEWTLGPRRIPVWMVIRLSAEVTRQRPRNVDFKIRPIRRSDLRLCSLLLGSHGGTEPRRERDSQLAVDDARDAILDQGFAEVEPGIQV